MFPAPFVHSFSYHFYCFPNTHATDFGHFVQESECKTPGLEFSGRVLAVNGDDRSTVKVGDRVVSGQ